MFELRRKKSAPNTPIKQRSNSLSSSKEFISIPVITKIEKSSCLVKSDDCSTTSAEKFGSLKKPTREKTVDFDFSHRNSSENLTEITSTPTKCQKHSGLMKNCPKHNPQLTVPKCNSCLTKTNSNKKIYYQSKSIENHQSSSSNSSSCNLTLKKSNSLSSNKCAKNAAEPICSSKNSKCFCKTSPKGKTIILPRKKLNWGPQNSRNVQLNTKLDNSCDLEVQKIRDRISQVEIFLEALGNAKTCNNFNSSRFVSKFSFPVVFFF